MRVAFIFLLLIAAMPAVALELEGTISQGGLLIGHVEPGARVAVEGREVRVSAEGYFLVGFARDAPSLARLKVTLADGGVQSRVLKVAKREYQIQRIDGLPEKQVTPDPEAQKRIDADNAEIADVRRQDTDKPYFATGFVWPVDGPISGVYGSQRLLNGKPRSPHNGIDIAAPLETVISSPADGVAALVRQDMFYTGKTMMIDHGHGLTSVYAHLSEIFIKEGQRIAKGQPIGKVGKSGRATGPHLHWGVTLHNTPLDPALAAGGGPKITMP